MQRPRFLVAEFKHETNTFASKKAGREEYRARYIKNADEIVPFFTGVKAEIGGFIDSAAQTGAELVPVIAANAMPSGPVTRDMFNHVRDTIIAGVRSAGHLDGILLSLHGAMVVEDSFDGEGELLEAIRKEVGPDMPIMITLDFHANMTEKMVKNCSALFGYNTYPHIDTYERGLEAAGNIVKMIRKEIKPVIAMRHLPMMIPSLQTEVPPFSDVFDVVFGKEKLEGVINVSWFQGFPWTDIPYVGSSVVAITNDDPVLAGKIVDEIAKMVWDMRERFEVTVVEPALAIKEAMEAPNGPYVLADIADNPGGGAPGDGTQVIAELIKAGAQNVAVAIIYDPEVVAAAVAAGPGAEIEVMLGGKTEPVELHGQPLKVKAVVRTLSDGQYINKGPMNTGFRADIGKTAVLDVNGIEIIVPERRMQPTDPQIFRRHGIEPLEKKAIVLKSTLHYRAGFGPLAEKIIQLDIAGLMSPNFNKFSYKHLGRPVWPRDKDAKPDNTIIRGE